jgi:hypothetical protein
MLQYEEEEEEDDDEEEEESKQGPISAILSLFVALLPTTANLSSSRML